MFHDYDADLTDITLNALIERPTFAVFAFQTTNAETNEINVDFVLFKVVSGPNTYPSPLTGSQKYVRAGTTVWKAIEHSDLGVLADGQDFVISAADLKANNWQPMGKPDRKDWKSLQI